MELLNQRIEEILKQLTKADLEHTAQISAEVLCAYGNQDSSTEAIRLNMMAYDQN